jgi:hypothetical protein
MAAFASSGFMAFKHWLMDEAAVFRAGEDAAQPGALSTSDAKPLVRTRKRVT